MDVAAAERGTVSRLEGRNDEVRAALFGLERSALGLSRRRDRLSARQFEMLTDGLVAEVRQLRAMLEGGSDAGGAFDLGDAIAPAIATARAAGLDVRSSLSWGIEVHGHRDSAAEVVLALLDNAREHAGRSPVDVRATVFAGAVELAVDDRGPGISGRSRQRLFDRDPRGEHSLGSGLFIARRLMADQGGSIAYRARPGGGASFVLRFALASSTSRRTRQHPSPRSRTLREVSPIS